MQQVSICMITGSLPLSDVFEKEDFVVEEILKLDIYKPLVMLVEPLQSMMFFMKHENSVVQFLC